MPVYHLTSPTIISVMFLSGKPCLKCHACIPSHIISVMFLSGKPCLKCHTCIPSHIITVMFLSGKPCLKCHVCIPSHIPHHYISDVPYRKALFEVPCLYTISHPPPLYQWCSFLESLVWSAMSVYHLTSPTIISVMFLSGKPCLKCHACIPSHIPHHYISDVPFWKALFEVPCLYTISHYNSDIPFRKALFEVPCLYTISHPPPLYQWCSFQESLVRSAMPVYHLTL